VFHIIAILMLFTFAPFGKFGHVWYRSFALWIHYGLVARKEKLIKELKREKAKAKQKF